MVTISPHSRSASGRKSRRQIAAVYLLIGSIVLLLLNALSVPDAIEVNNLRGPSRSVQAPASVELDVNNAIASNEERLENESNVRLQRSSDDVRSIELADNAILNEVDKSSSTPTGSPTFIQATNPNEAATTTTTPGTATTTATAATVSIRDMILKRSLEVKEFVMDQFSGRFNSPLNPRYHPTLQKTSSKPAPRSLSCELEDAFAGVPIDAWVPNNPGGYSRETLTQWERSFNASMKLIREETAGGDKLREFAEKEVKELRALRHSLFCKRE